MKKRISKNSLQNLDFDEFTEESNWNSQVDALNSHQVNQRKTNHLTLAELAGKDYQRAKVHLDDGGEKHQR